MFFPPRGTNGLVWPSPFAKVTARLCSCVSYQNVCSLHIFVGDSALPKRADGPRPFRYRDGRAAREEERLGFQNDGLVIRSRKRPARRGSACGQGTDCDEAEDEQCHPYDYRACGQEDAFAFSGVHDRPGARY